MVDGPKMQRRSFITASAALPALSALPRAGFAWSTSARAGSNRPIAVVDSRFPAGAFFEDEARVLGGEIHRIDADITPIWMMYSSDSDLRKATFVGLTTPQSLFALQLMMRSEGLRIVHWVHHSTTMPAASARKAALDAVTAVTTNRFPADANFAPSMWEGREGKLVSWTIAPG